MVGVSYFVCTAGLLVLGVEALLLTFAHPLIAALMLVGVVAGLVALALTWRKHIARKRTRGVSARIRL